MVHVQHLLQTLESLPAELQQEVVDFADFLAQRRATGTLSSSGVSKDKLAEQRRQGVGELQGKIWMSDDFNESLEDFKDY
ncbi:type II toxin-antitoxin system VapB family antitoxin [Hymenobacter weizhouensis]|uniref:type II toxin-antitoxin system VapB family antitoxin n=1 Tax=Hymenobacter sp. YIM 151500-1 TaxID=2987689 RepID=UPI002227A7CC|nr:DUF2281 domain-containing protein [Hymenobacter sp. YIM 151500-1]UYZ63834.1 DUF2281 domain-containing protein [Hymenobacter sp. YIM 151500-1]